MSDSGTHAVVFEAARGVHAFVLQVQVASVQANKLADTVSLLEQRLPLTNGDNLVLRNEGQQFVKSPDARETHWVGALAPHGLEVTELAGHVGAVPVIGHVQQ